MYYTKLFLIFLFFDSILSIKYWSYTEFKNPTKNPYFCKIYEYENTFICDPQKYLSKHKKTIVSSYLKDITLRSPGSCRYTRKSEGLVIGVIIVSRVKSYQPNCNNQFNYRACFARHVMKDWHMSSCGNDVMILIEEKSNDPKASVYFGDKVKDSISQTCINRITRDVDQSLTSAAYLEMVINKIYLYTTDSDYCMKVDVVEKWQIKTELLIGLIVAAGCIVVLLIFIVPYYLRRPGFTEIRNSNIVRPTIVNVPVKDSVSPPNYSEILFEIKRTEPDIVVVDLDSESTNPPTYLAVTSSPAYVFKKDFQLKI